MIVVIDLGEHVEARRIRDLRSPGGIVRAAMRSASDGTAAVGVAWRTAEGWRAWVGGRGDAVLTRADDVPLEHADSVRAMLAVLDEVAPPACTLGCGERCTPCAWMDAVSEGDEAVSDGDA